MKSPEKTLDELLRSCTVRIRVESTVGTGFFVAPGLILTCAHVVAKAMSGKMPINIHWMDEDHPVQIKSVLPDTHADLALLSINLEGQPDSNTRLCVYLNDAVKIGDKLYGYGYTDEYMEGDSALFVNEGPSNDRQPLLRLKDAQVRPGLSGAPLLNLRTGGVCGVVSRSRDRNSALGGRAIPVAVVLENYPFLVQEQARFHKKHPTWLRRLDVAGQEKQARLSAYRKRLRETDTRNIDFRGIPPLLPWLEIPLDTAYVHLMAIEERQSQAKREEELQQVRSRAKTKVLRPSLLDQLRSLGEYLYQRGHVYEWTDRPQPVDPENVVHRQKRLVILGSPGSGKSTLLRFLARKVAEQSDGPVPILISARNFEARLNEDSSAQLRSFALDQASAADKRLRSALEEVADDGQILWLVDGLDEARQWRERLAYQASLLSGQLVLTSRPVGYQATHLESLPHYEILPLSREDVDHFISTMIELIAQQRGLQADWKASRLAWLKEQLGARPQIRTLAANPLMLTFLILLATTQEPSELPYQRAQLYELYVTGLLKKSEVERQIANLRFKLGSLTDANVQKVVLEGLYFAGWFVQTSYFGKSGERAPTYENLVAALDRFYKRRELPQVATDVVTFWMEAEILDEWSLEGATTVLAFRHMTFQEFGVAWMLKEGWLRDRQHTWVRCLLPVLHHPAWRVPILLFAGLMNDHPEQLNHFVERLLSRPSLYERLLNRDVRLAAAIVAENVHVDKVLRERIAKRVLKYVPLRGWPHKLPWWDWLFVLPDLLMEYPLLFMVLSLVGASLAWLQIIPWYVVGVLQFLVVLTALLDADVLDDTWFAAKLVFPLRVARIALNWSPKSRALVSALLDVRPLDSELRSCLFKDWCYRRSSETSLRLEDAEIRAIQHLGPDEIQEITTELQAEDPIVRAVAVETLGFALAPAVLPKLLEMMGDSEELVRDSVAGALGRLKVQAIEPAIQALETGDAARKSCAVALLGEISDPRGVEPLIRALRREPDLRRSIASALAKLGDHRAVKPLIDVLGTGPDGFLRRDVAIALGKLGDARAIEALLLLLSDDEQFVRSFAAEGLGQLHASQAIAPLLQALEDEDSFVREKVAGALGEIEAPELIGILLEKLVHGKKHARSGAALSLGRLRALEAVQALIEVFGDRDEEVRRCVAKALGQIGAVEAVPRLIDALHDPDWYVRRNAAEALGQIGTSQVIEPLIQALSDRDHFPRWEAAKGLLKLGPGISNKEQMRHCVRALRWQVTNIGDPSREAAFVALDQLCNRLAELEVDVHADSLQ